MTLSAMFTALGIILPPAFHALGLGKAFFFPSRRPPWWPS
jgi:hypothetical protein